MHSWEALPHAPLSPAGAITQQFISRGLLDFRAAARHLHALPYGRNSDRAGFTLVLTEARGTCSTKHALLAALAREQQIDVQLMLGIYEMHERNTPGVGAVLAAHGLAAVAEAHCYLRYEDLRVDITRSTPSPREPIGRFLHEEVIAPEQIGEYKVALHRRFLRTWTKQVAPQLSWEQVWMIREQCIAALNEAD